MPKKRKTAKSSAKRSVRKSDQAYLSVATNKDRATKERVAALAEAPLAVCESDQNLQAMLKVLRDENEPQAVRLGALQSLQAASFSVVAFESCRADYTATLRKVALDPDMELRQRVLGLLAREKDGFAQKKLIEGLKNPEKALLPPEKALQLLSYDVHSDAYPVAREIVKKPPNATAKREALKLLGADATAAPMFEKILRDKDEDPEIRQISAAALQGMQPEKLQAHAREILMDASENDDLQATSLTALTNFGDTTTVTEDLALMKSVENLRGKSSKAVKQSARQFLNKYSR
jgi:hypothetical protein